MPLTLDLTESATRALMRLAHLQARGTSLVDLATFAEHLLAEAISERLPRAENIARARRAHERAHERAGKEHRP